MKPENEITDTVKLRAQVQILEARLRDKKMEIESLSGVWQER